MGFAWGGQQNGRIDNSLMVDTGGGQFLRADAAAGLAQLKGAFRATFGKDLTTSECYRPYQRQVDLYNLYRLGQGNVASIPGGSIHGWGLAIDINSWTYGGRAGTPEHNWLIDAGRAYGWDWFGTGKPSGEPWHFDFSLTPTATAASASTPTAVPTLTDIRKMTMILIRAQDTGACALIGEFTAHVFVDENSFTFQANLNTYGPYINVSSQDVMQTMVNEATARRGEIVAALKA